MTRTQSNKQRERAAAREADRVRTSAREAERMARTSRAASRIIPLGRQLDAETWASLPTGTTATVALPDGRGAAMIVHARPGVWTMSVPHAEVFEADELVKLASSRVWIPEPVAAVA